MGNLKISASRQLRCRKSAVTAAAVMIAAVLIYTSAGAAAEENNDETVRRLVSMRTDAMNGYFASELSYWEAGDMLREAETGRLLHEDLKCLKQYFRTDIEEVTAYEIKEVIFSYESSDLLCAVVKIHWKTAGIEGEESFTLDYSAICEKEEEKFKLVQFF